MCGIAGYFSMKGPCWDRPDLRGMNSLLVHRGPDDEGYAEDARAGIAMRRLSIIDLETGKQPIWNENKTVGVVLNGEIYNFRELRTLLEKEGHQFATKSDTEVLVHGYEEWGKDLPKRLRGMFAFAIRDLRSDTLMLVRDPFGIKPLYYARTKAFLLFASEMKSLLAQEGVSKDLDLASVSRYLSFLYMPEPATVYLGIRALPHGHTMTLSDSGIAIERYWRFEPHTETYPGDEAACERIRHSVRESVRAMLVSDVPVGVFLSGGLDSASILDSVARLDAGPIRTFTIGFGARERRWDELAAARRIAAHYTTEHHEFIVEPDIVKLLPEVLRHFDQPFANPTAAILYLLAGETRKHVKVALSGTGGDEMFAGYPRYLGMQLLERYRVLPAFARQVIANVSAALVRDASDGRPAWQRVRRLLAAGALPFAESYLSMVATIQTTRKQGLLDHDTHTWPGEKESVGFIRQHLGAKPAPDDLERLMAADLDSYLPFNQLAYADRMSMAQSLEIRVPFVDQELIKTAGSIPLNKKLRGGKTKGLFREAMRPCLPPEIIDAPKLGLNLPIALWFRESLAGWVDDVLAPKNLRRDGYFRPAAVQSLLEEHRAGKRDWSLTIWALIVFETWRQGNTH